jgi:hypothetical protein
MKSISKIITAILLTATCSISALADETININDVTDGDNGTGWSFAGSTLTITTGGTYTITGTGPTANRIKVNTGVTAYITLSNVDISTSACAFDMISGAKVNLTLKGVNALKSGANNAGLQVPSGAFLTITEASAGGTLTANGSGGGNTAGAGIGGGNNGSGGSITINGGTVIAYGGVGSGTYGYCGAGIGGGNGGSGGTIIINGGTVIADGSSGGMNYGNCSAGIGGGSNGAGGNITINGGAVTATGRTSGKMPGYYSSSAGIGGGHNGAGGNITINGGRVIAKVGVTFYGAEIKTVAIGGGGQNGSIGNIVINGGTVTATRVNDNANSMDIGGGNSTGSIVIRGGSINATRFTRQPVNGAGASVYRNILTLTDDGLAASDAQVTAGIIGSIACDPTNTLPPAGYGIKDVKTDAQGKVSFYLPSTSTNESIRLTADDTSYEASYKRVAGDNDQTLLPVSPELVVSGANADNPAYVKWSGDVLVFKQDGTYTVSMLPGVTTTNYSTILVNPGVTADITLDGVSIDVSGTSGVCAFDMTGATVNLTLTNSNTLKSGENKAGLQVVSGSTLEITAASTGSLMAAGGRSAGIGGGFGAGIGLDAGTIIIRGGTVTASGDRAAGIGGGDNYGKGGDVIISGGTVTAIGGAYGAAIGGGLNRNNTGSVTITGGSVKVNNHDGPPPTNGIVPVYYNILTVGDPAVDNDISVTAGSISGVDCDVTPDASAGVYGIRDVKTRDYGKVYFFLPSTDVDEWVILTAGGAEWGKSYTRNNNNSNAGSLDISAYGIKLSQTGTHTFPGDDYGYDAQTPLDITVTNTGYNATGTLTIALSGAGASAFTPSKTSIAIAVDGTDNFTVTPNTELDAGTYTATVTVSGGNGISENFDVSFKVNKATPTLADLDYPDPILPVTYDGSAHSVTVTDAPAAIGLGAITVKYNDNPTAPTDANTYAVTVDVEEGTNYAPATLSLGNLVINKATPTPADLTYSPALVTYNGLPQPLTLTDVKAKDGITGLGTVTAVYYNGSPTAPTVTGTYKITVDVAEGDNYLAATLLLGDYTIADATPPASAFNFDLLPVTYDGKPHPVTVAAKPGIVGLGAITAIKYNGSTDVPTTAGTYTVTIDLAAGASYTAIANLSLGSFTIDKATPTLAALDFTLGDIVCSGTPYPVPVIPAKDIEGLGAITIYYNGSTTVPVDPGEYVVTIDIAAGDNYEAVTGLSLGAFTIQEPPIPVPTHFRVLLPSAAGLTTDPPAGTYNVNRGSNFTFTLTPDVPSADGTPPQVQTNRPTPNVPNASGIRITPNADDSYTVVIIGIRQDIEITLAVAGSKSDPTNNESVAAGLNIYTAPGAIIVTNSRPDAALVRVYSLAGTLVRLTTVPPGTTRLAVPSGIYIVTDGGAFRRKTAVFR